MCQVFHVGDRTITPVGLISSISSQAVSTSSSLVNIMSSQPESFTGDWVTPEHPGYTAAIARWAINAERRAKVVAFVKNAQDVATVLKYAKQNNYQVAVRGGGHSTSGASSVEGGVVVDLSRHLSGVRVDPAEKLAYVGGGAIWESVDKATTVHGLATVAGTVNHVSSSRCLFHFRSTYTPFKDRCRRVRTFPLPLTPAPFTAPISAFCWVGDTAS